MIRTLVIALGALSLSALASPSAHADTLRLSPGDKLARMDKLTPGTNRYLRYVLSPDGGRKTVDIWSRTVAVEPDASGKPALHISMRWDQTEAKTVLFLDSWFDAGTFRPRTHVRRVVRDGQTTIGGYRFVEGKVVGMADLAGNTRGDFSEAMPEPHFNFEQDMEFLRTLPMAAGRTFDIPFYDPGRGKPARYRFVVAGSEQIPGPDGRPMDCWLVTADYNSGRLQARYWFAKANQVLVRGEQAMPDGGVMIKALLLPESPTIGFPPAPKS